MGWESQVPSIHSLLARQRLVLLSGYFPSCCGEGLFFGGVSGIEPWNSPTKSYTLLPSSTPSKDNSSACVREWRNTLYACKAKWVQNPRCSRRHHLPCGGRNSEQIWLMIRVKIGQASYAVRGNQYVCSKMLSRLNSVVICHLGKEYKVELIIT